MLFDELRHVAWLLDAGPVRDVEAIASLSCWQIDDMIRGGELGGPLLPWPAVVLPGLMSAGFGGSIG